MIQYVNVRRVYEDRDGSTLAEPLTSTFEDGGNIKVDSVAPFGNDPDEDPGEFVIRNHDRTITEIGTFDGVDERLDLLLRCTRPDAKDWPVGTEIEADNPAELRVVADVDHGVGDMGTLVEVPIREDLWLWWPVGAVQDLGLRAAMEMHETPGDNYGECTIISPPLPDVETYPMMTSDYPGKGTWQLDRHGFRLYNAAGELTFNAESEDGDLFIVGTFTNGPEGETRWEMSSSVSTNVLAGIVAGVDLSGGLSLFASGDDTHLRLIAPADDVDHFASMDLVSSPTTRRLSLSVDKVQLASGSQASGRCGLRLSGQDVTNVTTKYVYVAFPYELTNVPSGITLSASGGTADANVASVNVSDITTRGFALNVNPTAPNVGVLCSRNYVTVGN